LWIHFRPRRSGGMCTPLTWPFSLLIFN
jgi:hypothetical protein